MTFLFLFTISCPIPGFFFRDQTQTHTRARSVGLLWTRGRPVAEPSAWQHTTFTKDGIHAPGGIQTRNPSKRVTSDVSLRPRGHPYYWLMSWNKNQGVQNILCLFPLFVCLLCLFVCLFVFCLLIGEGAYVFWTQIQEIISNCKMEEIKGKFATSISQ
jgi:hypothetical protein